jgi:SSS family solute:Na+ symporter
MARMGTVIYLLALAVAPLTGWKLQTTIAVTATLMTVYTMVGGMRAVIWTGVLQSAVLVAGTALCIAMIVLKTPGGLAVILQSGAGQDKFSLGNFGASLTEPTFWVVFLFGLVTHLTNFGVDQSYIQRYITARDDREARRSVWLTAFLYLPVAAVFFFIGTSLFVFYSGRTELLGTVTRADDVFPHFIKTQLPVGMAGLVVAGIFAASMDANFNSMATLTLCDLYQRYIRPQAGEREAIVVLRLATLGWGLASMGVSLALIRAGTALDAWWQLAGMFSGGVLGLFLLGRISRRADNAAGAIAVAVGALVIIWMSLPQLIDVPASVRNPLHANLTIVVGTLSIFLVGLMAAQLRGRWVRGSAAAKSNGGE